MSSSHYVMRPHRETVKEAPHSKSAEGEGATRGVRCVFSAILVVLNCMFFSSFLGRTIAPMIVCFDWPAGVIRWGAPKIVCFLPPQGAYAVTDTRISVVRRNGYRDVSGTQ